MATAYLTTICKNVSLSELMDRTRSSPGARRLFNLLPLYQAPFRGVSYNTVFFSKFPLEFRFLGPQPHVSANNKRLPLFMEQGVSLVNIFAQKWAAIFKEVLL
jgi:hypothetical protein